MIFEIKNEHLTINVNSKGAELWSIKDDEDKEYLWQGEQYWKGKTPNLFPYVGKFTEGKYSLYGKEYPMDIHGFVRNTEFELIEHTAFSISLGLTDNGVIYAQYPYHFKMV